MTEQDLMSNSSAVTNKDNSVILEGDCFLNYQFSKVGGDKQMLQKRIDKIHEVLPDIECRRPG